MDFKLLDVFQAVHSGAWGSKKPSTIRVLTAELNSYAVAPRLVQNQHIACYHNLVGQQGSVRLAPKIQISKLRLAHLDFDGKLNSKSDQFSSIFYLSTPSAAKMRFFCTFYNGKMPKKAQKINKIDIWPKSALEVIIS